MTNEFWEEREKKNRRRKFGEKEASGEAVYYVVLSILMDSNIPLDETGDS